MSRTLLLPIPQVISHKKSWFLLCLLLPIMAIWSVPALGQFPSSNESTPWQFGQPNPVASTNAGQSQILQAQSQQLRKVEVIFSAPVLKLLPDDTEGMPHQRFLLRLENGTTVLVAHNTKYAPKVPLARGALVTIRGEYIWNEKGGVVHWTHRSDTPRHVSGYIEYGGVRYQ